MLFIAAHGRRSRCGERGRYDDSRPGPAAGGRHPRAQPGAGRPRCHGCCAGSPRPRCSGPPRRGRSEPTRPGEAAVDGVQGRTRVGSSAAPAMSARPGRLPARSRGTRTARRPVDHVSSEHADARPVRTVAGPTGAVVAKFRPGRRLDAILTSTQSRAPALRRQSRCRGVHATHWSCRDRPERPVPRTANAGGAPVLDGPRRGVGSVVAAGPGLVTARGGVRSLRRGRGL